MKLKNKYLKLRNMEIIILLAQHVGEIVGVKLKPIHAKNVEENAIVFDIKIQNDCIFVLKNSDFSLLSLVWQKKSYFDSRNLISSSQKQYFLNLLSKYEWEINLYSFINFLQF